MPRGGYRPNSGPAKGTKYKKRKPSGDNAEFPPDIEEEAKEKHLTPKEYLTQLMNDPKADNDRRDRAASILMPYEHARLGEGKGKKEVKDEKAKEASKGRFAPGNAPLKVVK